MNKVELAIANQTLPADLTQCQQTEGARTATHAALQAEVTQLRRENAALRESKERYRAFLQTSAEGVWCFELRVPLPIDLPLDEQVDCIYMHGYYAECNDMLAQMYGYTSAEDIIGNPLGQMLPETARNREGISALCASGYRMMDCESHEVDRYGNPRIFLNNIVGIIEDGHVVRFWGTQRDITEQKQTEAALRISETRFRTLLAERERAAQERAVELSQANAALKCSLSRLTDQPDLDAFLSYVLSEVTQKVGASAGYVFLFNPTVNTLSLRMSVRDGQTYIGAAAHDLELFHAPFPADITPAFDYMCRTRQIYTLTVDDFNGMAWPGTTEWHYQMGHQEAAALALMAGDRPVGMLGLSFREKTALNPEAMELIQALANQATLAIQLTRLAEQSQQSALLEERNRIAREIHDTLAQAFTGIVMQLQAATRLLATNPEQSHECIARAQALARSGIAEARRSVWALRAEATAASNLSAALTRLVEQVTTGTSIQAEVLVQGTPRILPTDFSINLQRIGQEALTNALRHAQARIIQIKIVYSSHQVCLRVRDDGQGFSPHQTGEVSSFGLLSMQQRAEQIGAELKLTSQPGGGTEVVVTVPLAED